MSDRGHRDKRIRTNKNSQGALANALLALHDEAVEQRLQSQTSKEKRQSTSFLSFMLTLMSILRLKLQSSCLLFRREKMQLGFWRFLNFLALELIGLLHNLHLNVCNR